MDNLPRTIDFDTAEVRRVKLFAPEGTPPVFELSVTGTKSHADHDVNLMPLRHEQQPEFWSIVVVESAGSSSEPPSSEFEEVISLADNVGTRGVEVIGPTRSERIEVPFQADPIE
jgi:hypothetical protein